MQGLFKEHKSFWWTSGLVAFLCIAALVFLPAAALLTHLDSSALTAPVKNPWLQRVIVFSFTQATLSTVLAVGLSIPLAHILSWQHRFVGRVWLLSLFSLAFVVPTVVAVFGLVAVFGGNGWINHLAGLVMSGQDDFRLIGSIYGLGGILLAHTFFNLPFATRVLLQSIEALSIDTRRSAAIVGMSRWQMFRLLEWPAIRGQLPGLSLLVFTLCFTSFSIVLTLGGGPRATTIEVAIYQALRFDFDLGAAVALSVVQFFCCAALVLLARRTRAVDIVVDSYTHSSHIADGYRSFFQRSGWRNVVDFVFIALAFLFVVLPLVAVLVVAAKPAFFLVVMQTITLKALVNSLWVAITSGLLCIALTLGLLVSVRHLDLRLNRPLIANLVQHSGFLILVLPPVVLGTGMFLLLRNYADVFSLALVLTLLINSLMGLPFAMRIIGEPLWQTAKRYDHLCATLGIANKNRRRLIEWPHLRKPVTFALAIVTTLSAGDLTAIALFGSERVVTLPLLLYQRMGSYRIFDAAATAALLLIVCFILYRLIERLGR